MARWVISATTRGRAYPAPKQQRTHDSEFGYRTGHHGAGHNDAGIRDIDEGLYGIRDSLEVRGRGRKVYVHVMRLLGLEGSIELGLREDEFFGQKRARTEEDLEKKRRSRAAQRSRRKARKREETGWSALDSIRVMAIVQLVQFVMQG
jgi:hypothetical protein